jgi:hypothetical protein
MSRVNRVNGVNRRQAKDGADWVVVRVTLDVVAVRARWPSGRIKHFKVWGPGHSVEVVCEVCEHRVRRMKSDLRPGQRTFCGPVCRTIWRMLVGVQRSAVGR